MFLNSAQAAGPINDVAVLVAAVRDAQEGAIIELGPETFELEASLELKTGMTLKGAGLERTVLTHAPSWKPSTKTLPDPG